MTLLLQLSLVEEALVWEPMGPAPAASTGASGMLQQSLLQPDPLSSATTQSSSPGFNANWAAQMRWAPDISSHVLALA